MNLKTCALAFIALYVLNLASIAHAARVTVTCEDKMHTAEGAELHFSTVLKSTFFGRVNRGTYMYTLKEGGLITGKLKCKTNEDRWDVCRPTRYDAQLQHVVVTPMGIFSRLNGTKGAELMQCNFE